VTAPATKDPQSGFGCGLICLIIVLGLAMSYCSKNDGASSSTTAPDTYEQAADNLEAAAEVAEPASLNAVAVRKGSSQLRLMTGLDLPNAPQIFSKNCYEALSKRFNWTQLDRCGGFDAAAVRLIEVEPSASGSELEYFEPEIAAGRYLTAATGNGLAASLADERWAALEGLARRVAPAKTVEAVTTTISPIELLGANEAVDANVPTEDERLINEVGTED
jgi:hypothetical protein